jgi:hypothetical protein
MQKSTELNPIQVGLEATAVELFNCKLVQSVRHYCDVLHNLHSNDLPSNQDREYTRGVIKT